MDGPEIVARQQFDGEEARDGNGQLWQADGEDNGQWPHLRRKDLDKVVDDQAGQARCRKACHRPGNKRHGEGRPQELGHRQGDIETEQHLHDGRDAEPHARLDEQQVGRGVKGGVDGGQPRHLGHGYAKAAAQRLDIDAEDGIVES